MESDSEIAENGVFMSAITLLDHSFLERDDTNTVNNETDDWKDEPGNELTSEA